MVYSKFIKMLIFSGLILSQNAISHEKIESLNFKPECNSQSHVTKDRCNYNKNGYSELFIQRYNIHSTESNNSYGEALRSDRFEIRYLVKRYREAYSKLNNLNDKIAFVNLFLDRASKKYNMTLKIADRYDKSINIIVNGFKGHNNLAVGYSISLFGNDILNSDISNLYLESLSTLKPNSFTQKISEDVDYVLGSSSNNISKLTLNQAIHSLTSNNREEKDDDDSSEDEEYIEWAEEQAEGWGDDYEYWWDENDAGEEFITFEDIKTGEQFDAYHFTPSGG